MSICKFEGCGNGHYAHGLCNSHWKQRRKGKPLTPLRFYNAGGFTLDKLLAQGVREGDCILWSRAQNGYGYGVTNHGGGNWATHRLAYHLATGEDITGAQIHHKCAIRLCMNPDHLQRASAADNSLEMLARKDYEARIQALETRVQELEAQLDNAREVIR